MYKLDKFLKLQVKKKRLSIIEKTLVDSTFRLIRAISLFAKLHAFEGVYSLYPREFDAAKSTKGYGLVYQPRFSHLLLMASLWRLDKRPDVERVMRLSVQVIAEYAKQHHDKCVKTDLRELSKDIIKLGSLGKFNSHSVNYFKYLMAELNK